MNHSGFLFRNSFVHRMNPSLKFLMIMFIIAMIFIPSGFVFQLFLLSFCLFLFFLAKLPMRKLLKMLQSVLILACVLLLVNWITYKQPGVDFNPNVKAYFLYKPNFLYQTTSHSLYLENLRYNNQPITPINVIFGDLYGGSAIELGHRIDFEKDLMSQQQLTVPNKGMNDHVFALGKGFYLWVKNNMNMGLKIEDLQAYVANQSKQFTNIRYMSNVWQSLSNNQPSSYMLVYFYGTNWYTFSSYAVFLLIFVVLRIFLMIMTVSLLTSTTSPIELTTALEDLLNPLVYLRIPVKEWSIAITLGLRFIPSLIEESNRILNAQASRGLDFKNGHVIDKVRSLTSLIVPLFYIAFKKAAELADAMEARGYHPRYLRTRYRNYVIRWADWLFFGFSLFLFGTILALLTIKGRVLFAFFGVYELLIIL